MTRRGTSATGAVREALREALARDAERRSGNSQRLLNPAEQSRTMPKPLLTAAELSYALAVVRDEPLLFEGNDFGHTDVQIVDG